MDNATDGYFVKISDFGLAKIRQETSQQTTDSDKQRIVGGTLQWKAPELLRFGKPSKASDIYSLGVVFWELATGCVPYEELDEATISQGVKAGERLEIPNDVPSTFASIISNAWSQEPSKRPTAQQLIEQIITISPATKETPMISKFSPTPVLPNASSSTMLANYSIESAAVPVTDTSNKGM
ncbi:unnamed protein product [Rotaria sordida]|uniref:Protein kinase domain-containing protein n=1 Tax=Rotaria sordida TaxID=392033 RepID=A0A814U599_9BILA|nr:unnamed protein product [Rotaria sordida]CAF1423268.1 unnamed protein product [Rotaria sordida]